MDSHRSTVRGCVIRARLYGRARDLPAAGKVTRLPRAELEHAGDDDIRIHAIDIVQPPGIAVSPIADMDTHRHVLIALPRASLR